MSKSLGFSPFIRAFIFFWILFSMSYFSEIQTAQAWGKRGHAIVAETAAYLVSEQPNASFLKSHSFDLEYYANVPDIVWKTPATYDTEAPNHFMDMEIFNRELKESKVERPFELSRLEFNSTFPKIRDNAGRAWWRIREFDDKLTAISNILEKSNLSTSERQQSQSDWLLMAGTLGHYVGDLSQPLHVTENFDGQMTNQKGVHSFFEELLVDELSPELEVEVFQSAKSQWHDYHKRFMSKSVLEVIQSLSTESNAELPEVLKNDKSKGRLSLSLATGTNHKLIVARLSRGSLALAEIWQRHTGWKFDGKKFYQFIGSPEYIYPPRLIPQPSGEAPTPVSGAIGGTLPQVQPSPPSPQPHQLNPLPLTPAPGAPAPMASPAPAAAPAPAPADK
jgi:hypothetical protein